MSYSGKFKYSAPGKVPAPTERCTPFKAPDQMAGTKDNDDALVGGDGNMPVKDYKKSGRG
jgi:hypothetical protein